MFDRVFSQSSARVVAIARLALAAVFLVATVSDPRLAPTGDVIVLTAYLGFAALVLLLIWRDWWTDARIAVATHVIDILFFMIVVLWPEGYARPYFLFFVFLLLSAAIRWGWRATAFTAAVAILLYLAAGLFVARPAGTGFELQRFIIRSGYLVVLSFILIWFGLRRRFSTGVVVGDGPPELDIEADSPLEDAFRYGKAVLKAGAGFALWIDRGGGQEAFRIEGGQIVGDALPLVEPASLPQRTFLFAVAKDQALMGFDGPRRFRTASALLGDALLERIEADQGLAVPVHSQLGSGLLIYWSIDDLHSDHLELGGHLSTQLAQLIEHRALILARQDAAIARERMSLARDLHDGIVQFLAGSTYRIEAISRSLGDDSDAAANLQDLKELMLLEQEDLRTSIAALRKDTAALSQITSDARALCARLARHWQIYCNFTDRVADVPASTRLHLDILQSIREAVANAARHASAKSVHISLESGANSVQLTIADDGKPKKGGPTSAPWSIRERVEEAGGTVAIRSGRGGTRLELSFPITKERA